MPFPMLPRFNLGWLGSPVAPAVEHPAGYQFGGTVRYAGTLNIQIDTFTSDPITISWGDGAADNGWGNFNGSNYAIGNVLHTYTDPGPFTLVVTGLADDLVRAINFYGDGVLAVLDTSCLPSLSLFSGSDQIHCTFDFSTNALLTDLRVLNCGLVDLAALHISPENNPLITNLEVSNNLFTELSVVGFFLASLSATYCLNLVTLNIDDVAPGFMLQLNNSPITDLAFPHDKLGRIWLDGTGFTSIDLSDCVNLVYLDASYSNLTSLVASGISGLNDVPITGTPLQYVDLHNDGLTTSSTAVVLVTLNSRNTSDGFVDLTGNAHPKPNGITAKDALEGRGWTVLVDA